jgi:hypothetical protein
MWSEIPGEQRGSSWRLGRQQASGARAFCHSCATQREMTRSLAAAKAAAS